VTIASTTLSKRFEDVWWIWQNLHMKTAFGVQGISGTGIFLNTSPSTNTTPETPIDLGYAWEGVLPTKGLMSITTGPFCYICL
jgi:tyrosinase